jgi:hypothetical protein
MQQRDFLLSHRERDAAVQRFNMRAVGEGWRRITPICVSLLASAGPGVAETRYSC